MATRSFIGKQNSDGSIDYIYCHGDGFPSHNGVVLQNHYTSEEKINALLELGDLSWLGPELGEKQNFDKRFTQNDDWCLAYGRDRNDNKDAVKAKRAPDMEEYLNEGGMYVDYAYVFNNGEWKCYHVWEKCEVRIPKKELEANK